jgi:hypothetical protein
LEWARGLLRVLYLGWQELVDYPSPEVVSPWGQTTSTAHRSLTL